MHGGVILFRGTGTDARRYVEADRSRADDYYLGADTSAAQFTALDGDGNVNAPKSLSIAAALHPEVSDALDRAQQDAVAEIQCWLAQHSVTRVGPRGKQEVVPVEQLQTMAVSHRTSRAGDPHRHIHFQIGTRVWAAGKWRALDTAALFTQQGAIRALGTAVIAAHPELSEVLDRHGLTLDPVSGEVIELERFNGVMSKRGEQVRRHLERLEAEWEAAHPGETVGPVVSARLAAKAWAHERPAKKPTTLREEHAWVNELHEAGYDPDTLRRPARREPALLDDLSVQTVANRALDRCAAGGAWTLGRSALPPRSLRLIRSWSWKVQRGAGRRRCSVWQSRSPHDTGGRRGWLRRRCAPRRSRTMNSACPRHRLRRSCTRTGGAGTATAYGRASRPATPTRTPAAPITARQRAHDWRGASG